MITVIGVGHVFDIGRQVRDVILHRRPALVGVELDESRYWALKNRHTREDTGVLYRLISHFQKRIAHEYGVEVGDEMLAAIDAANDIGARVAFLDMDSATVLNRLWASMKFEERVKIFVSTIFSLFVGKKQVERELKRFDENSVTYIDEFAQHFPSAKKILIDDRDQHIAENIRSLSSKFERIVAVVGDGHVAGIHTRLSDLNPEVIRLRELRRDQTGSTVTVSFTVNPPEQ